jgi:hypothetical protein
MKHTIHFAGKIEAITRDGRSGVVALDRAISGKTFAVISPDTNGRIALMNGVGRLEKGFAVQGEAEAGSEGLRAVYIEAAKAAG